MKCQMLALLSFAPIYFTVVFLEKLCKFKSKVRSKMRKLPKSTVLNILHSSAVTLNNLFSRCALVTERSCASQSEYSSKHYAVHFNNIEIPVCEQFLISISRNCSQHKARCFYFSFGTWKIQA